MTKFRHRVLARQKEDTASAEIRFATSKRPPTPPSLGINLPAPAAVAAASTAILDVLVEATEFVISRSVAFSLPSALRASDAASTTAFQRKEVGVGPETKQEQEREIFVPRTRLQCCSPASPHVCGHALHDRASFCCKCVPPCGHDIPFVPWQNYSIPKCIVSACLSNC